MGLLSDFLSGVDDRPADQPEPLHLPFFLRLDDLVYDEDGALVGVDDNVFERAIANIPEVERSRNLQVHDWSIFFPPTIHEKYASTIIEYMVTRRR
jgi:hypothetical protein